MFCSIINGIAIKLISYGYCACGCGYKTNIAKTTDHRKKIKRGEPRKYINGHTARRNTQMNAGETINSHGYIIEWNPGHHRCQGKTGYVLKHILVLERVLGRKLENAEASHHIDGNKLNNDPENLMVFATGAMHIAFHRRQKALESCGNYEWRQCVYCHQWDDPTNMAKSGRGVFHRECKNRYCRKAGRK